MNALMLGDKRRIESVVRSPFSRLTLLTEGLVANQLYPAACHLTYLEFPTEWVWNTQCHAWTARKSGKSLGRLKHINPNAGELYYLRLLLTTCKGCTSFKALKSVAGFVYPTFRATCQALRLVGDDKEWHFAIQDASHWATSYQLRNLFTVILLFCDVSACAALLDFSYPFMVDDIVYAIQSQQVVPNMNVNEQAVKNLVLTLLEEILQRQTSTLEHFHLPLPDPDAASAVVGNRLLIEELSYDPALMANKAAEMYPTLNIEQRTVFDAVVASVENNLARYFFVYGHGGTGKTYLYNVIATKIRSSGVIVLAVASSGIAALLLPGGRTVHSRFKILLEVHASSSCRIPKGTKLAELLNHAKLIIWDEAPMTHRHCFEALNRTLNDICLPGGDDNNACFGNKTVVLGGDF